MLRRFDDYKIDTSRFENEEFVEALQRKIDQKTKPLGSLGRLEELAIQISKIQKSSDPEIKSPHVVLCAGDHGIAKRGVSPYPQEVTSQMLLNFANGGAAISVLCQQHDIKIQLNDCGTLQEINHPNIINRRLGQSTQDASTESALSQQQLEKAFENGGKIVADLVKIDCNTVALGEMGIGNTTAASLICSRLLDLPLDIVIGRGAGCDDQRLAQKLNIAKKAALCHSEANTALDCMKVFGGFEMATLMGTILAAASEGLTIVIDGFIVTACALAAIKHQPQIKDYLIFAHCSAEGAHQLILNKLEVNPLLNLGLRLGEGSGAALALPLLDSACRIMKNMASFSEAEVSSATEN